VKNPLAAGGRVENTLFSPFYVYSRIGFVQLMAVSDSPPSRPVCTLVGLSLTAMFPRTIHPWAEVLSQDPGAYLQYNPSFLSEKSAGTMKVSLIRKSPIYKIMPPTGFTQAENSLGYLWNVSKPEERTMSKRYVVTRICHVGGGRCGKCLNSDKVRCVQCETDKRGQADLCMENWEKFQPELVDREAQSKGVSDEKTM